MKALSVIVPSYNMQDYLPQCVESLLGGSDAIEILIVNDGSTDATSVIAHRYEQENPMVVRVIDKPNGHYGSAVNAGLAAATGFYVKVVDADDAADPEGLGMLLAVLAREMASGDRAPDLVVNDWVVLGGSADRPHVCRPPLPPHTRLDADSLAAESIRDLCLYAITYRTALLHEMGYHQTEGVPYTDTEWSVLPMRYVRSVIHVPQVVVRYRGERPGQTMAPETFARDFPVVVGLLERILSGWREGQERPLFSQWLVVLLGSIYYMHLAGPVILGRPTPAGDLADFDDRLKAYPDLYRRTGRLTLSQKLKFHYIREWRRNKTDRTVRFALWRLYVRCAKLVLRALG